MVSERGWFRTTNSSSLKKAFQVYAVTIPNNPENPAIATLRYQQDRAQDRANKWGAWFRTDLEVTPGPTFNWNGAMHTEGSLFVGTSNTLRFYLISDPSSCQYQPAANSELELRGQLMGGRLAANQPEDTNVRFDIYTAGGPNPENERLNSDEDSVATGNPVDVALDPRRLYFAEAPQSAGQEGVDWTIDENFASQVFASRATVGAIDGRNPCPPYIDDYYRADNRRGPKGAYTRPVRVGDFCIPEFRRLNDAGIDMGEDLPAQTTAQPINYIGEFPPSALSADDVGLDGYWERRARNEGLRVIESQRLELGNTFGWVFNEDADNNGGALVAPEIDLNGNQLVVAGANTPDKDPLNPPRTMPAGDAMGRGHEQKQRRTLRDNLAAVQSTAVYFYDEDGNFQSSANEGMYPRAVIASTVHPGRHEPSKILQPSAIFQRIFSSQRRQPLIPFSPPHLEIMPTSCWLTF